MPLALQAVDGVVSVALCLQVVSEAPQHLRSSAEAQATFDGFFARQSICSAISLDSSMPRARAVESQNSLKTMAEHCHTLV